MTALASHSPGKRAYLDRPQRLGFLPTSAFWNRRDVWKLVWLPTVIVSILWSVLLDLFVFDFTPIWVSGLLGGMGFVVFIGLLERYLRSRLRQRQVSGDLLASPAIGRGKDPQDPSGP